MKHPPETHQVQKIIIFSNEAKLGEKPIEHKPKQLRQIKLLRKTEQKGKKLIQ